jgi:hypothetical protein
VLVRGFHHSKRLFLIDIVVAERCDLPMIYKKISPLFFAAAVVTTALVSLSDLRAGASNKSGNPFGNGTFFSDAGTFSAVVRDTNGFLGTMQIVTSATNTTTNAASNSGVCTVYAEGQQFLGSSFGAINSSAQTIAVTYFGITTAQNVALPTVTYISGAVGSNTVVTPNYGLTNFSLSNNVAGQFSAKLANSYPNQTFSGNGQTCVFIQQANYTTTNFGIGGSTNLAYVYSVTNIKTFYNPSVTGVRLKQ